MKKRSLFVYIFLCGLGIGPLSAASVPLSVDISASSAILINAQTGAVLYQKNAQVPMFPASITKIATALYALEKKEHALDELIMATADAVGSVHPSIRRDPARGHPPYRLEFGGTHMGLKTGEILPLRTLLYGLMLESANDAANVIAQYVSGSTMQFVEELNLYIKTLGCTQTTFYAPHGLYHPEHKTTARDMAIITKRALEIPFFREMVKTLKYPRGTTNKQADADLFQHNALVKQGKFHYPKAIGVKTGYTLSSGYTLVGAAEDEHRKLILVLLGCSQLPMRYKDAITLFEAGFNEPKVARTLFSKQFDHFSYILPGAKRALIADLERDVILQYYASEEPDFTVAECWNELSLPIQEGQNVGEVVVRSPSGDILAREPLFSVHQIEGTFQYKLQGAWSTLKAQCRQYTGIFLALIGCVFFGIAFYCFHHPFKKRIRKKVSLTKKITVRTD
jgi:D-alanyl-D-alanine carboxypeptidase (penicillin-binding protein 5/6)